MENKYYTPDLSEFHIGFEYEYKNHTGTNKELSKLDWKKSIVNSINDLSYIERGLYIKDNTRVKYLDKEDIESLGYSLTKEDNTYKEFLKMGQFYKLHIVICPIFSEDLGVYINIFTNQNTDQTIRFSGFIKNKAELSKLLKQLNIL